MLVLAAHGSAGTLKYYMSRGYLASENKEMAKKNLDDTVFHLGSCSTCKEIIKATGLDKKGLQMREIKGEAITPSELDALKEKAGSYEALFSRRAIQYKERGLKDKVLTEKDYRTLILQEYTFLKRPVVISGGKIFIGSEKATRQALADAMSGRR